MISNKKILIVGGGFRGIAIANKLLNHKNEITLIEKAPFLGGVLFSEKWNNFYIDKGIHVFENVNDEYTKFILKILKNNYYKINIKYGSKINNNISNKVAVPDLTTLKLKEKRKIYNELLNTPFNKKKVKNLYDYFIYNYGKTASKYFIDGATKYFATDIKKLHHDTVINSPFNRGRFFDDDLTRFLKKFKEFDNKIALPLYNEPLKWVKKIKDNSFRFFYPKNKGLREFCDRAETYLKNKKINIKKGISINSIKKKNKKFICTFEDNSTDYFDIIFWTTSPINLYNNIFKNKLIKNTGIHNVPMVVYYFVVKIKNLNDFTFIQDFRKKTLIFRGATTGLLGKQIKNGETYIDIEIPTKINSKIWNNPSKYYNKIWKEALDLGLVKGKLPSKKKFLKTPVSFRAIDNKYYELTKKVSNKIKKYSKNIILLDQKNAPLIKIMDDIKNLKI